MAIPLLVPRSHIRCLLGLWAIFCGLPGAQAATIQGVVRLASPAHDDVTLPTVQVGLFRIDPAQDPEGLTKERFLGADRPQPLAAPPPDYLVTAAPVGGTGDRGPWQYQVAGVPPGAYAAVAFEPAGPELGGWLDFAPPRRQFLGLHVDERRGCSPSAYSSCVCAQLVEVAPGEAGAVIGEVDIVLRAPHLMPARAAVANGSLRRAGKLNATIVHVRGTAYERGFAQGLLLAPQIVDMVELFLLEDQVRSPAFYEGRFLPALRSLAAPTPQLRAGVRGMVAGLRAANHSLWLAALGRPVAALDILALNTYPSALAWAANWTEAAPPEDACSQFVFWGDAVSPEEVRGGSIAGRNMDGENDVRKLTVNDFVVHVVEPSEAGLQPLVHFMWPGFLTVSSGLNAQGRYLMENAGCNPPGPAAAGAPLKRDVIANLLLDASIPADVTPNQMRTNILRYKSADGGSCADGCIFVHALPYDAARARDLTAGFVFEGDRYGGAIRGPGEVAPYAAQGIMATNHYLRYRGGSAGSQRCDGAAPSFSSLARYFTGSNKVAAWTREPPGLRVGSAEMRELLRAVSHGTTEHSVIVKPNDLAFEVAVASPNGVWDAAYREYVPLTFAELLHGDDRDRADGDGDGDHPGAGPAMSVTNYSRGDGEGMPGSRVDVLRKFGAPKM